MRYRLTNTALALAFGLGTAGFACAASAESVGAGACEQRFAVVDIDDDGRISDFEAATWREHVFNVLDDDRDGTISSEEYFDCYESSSPVVTYRDAGDDRFADIDVNDDAVVSYDEYLRARGTGTAPSTSSSEVTAEEYEEEYEEAMERRAYYLERADLNGDGVISESETTAGSDDAFELLDQDEDGEISPEEWAAADTDDWESRERAALLAERFDEIDLDDDGELTLSELRYLNEQRLDVTTPVDPWGDQGYYLGL